MDALQYRRTATTKHGYLSDHAPQICAAGTSGQFGPDFVLPAQNSIYSGRRRARTSERFHDTFSVMNAYLPLTRRPSIVVGEAGRQRAVVALGFYLIFIALAMAREHCSV